MKGRYIPQSEALKIFKGSVRVRREWDTDSTFALRTLMMLNDFAKDIYGIRLFNIFEIIGINDDEKAFISLSYTFSNIEQLSNDKWIEVNKK